MKVAVWFVLTMLILVAIGYMPKTSSKIMADKVVAALKTTDDSDQYQNIADVPLMPQKPNHKIAKKEAIHKVNKDNNEYLAEKIEAKQP